MVGWHNWLDGHEFEQVPRDGDRQGCLACCSPWGQKESDTAEQLKNKLISAKLLIFYSVNNRVHSHITKYIVKP